MSTAQGARLSGDPKGVNGGPWTSNSAHTCSPEQDLDTAQKITGIYDDGHYTYIIHVSFKNDYTVSDL